MKIILNGKEEILEGPRNITGLLEQKKINPDTIVVEHNMEIIPKENYSKTVLKENDNIEILKLVGGG